MRRTWGLLAVAAAMTALLTGCQRRPAEDEIPTAQGGGGEGAPAPAPATTADVLAAMGEWAQCMRAQGFDIPDPYLDPESAS